jgi:hypothetical protein
MSDNDDDDMSDEKYESLEKQAKRRMELACNLATEIMERANPLFVDQSMSTVGLALIICVVAFRRKYASEIPLQQYINGFIAIDEFNPEFTYGGLESNEIN